MPTRDAQADEAADLGELVAKARSRRAVLAALLGVPDRQLEAARSLDASISRSQATALLGLATGVVRVRDAPEGAHLRRHLQDGSLPDQFYWVLVSNPGRAFPIREPAEISYGAPVSSKELETARRAALRLVQRGFAVGSSRESLRFLAPKSQSQDGDEAD